MLTGLQFGMKSEELREKLQERTDYHTAKAKRYAEQAAAMEGLTAPQGQSNDPRSQLQQSQRQHENKAAYFAFMATHVLPDETYIVGVQDLSVLELMDRYF